MDPLMLSLDLELEADAPRHRQVYWALRRAIETGTLEPGAKIPPSRVLAQYLGLSRTTVTTALAQLAAEGYITARVGSGTFVQSLESPSPPGEPLPPRKPPVLGHRTSLLNSVPETESRWVRRPFRPDVPALELFPIEIWARLSQRRWRHLSPSQLDYPELLGFWPLRQIIAQYLRHARGLKANAEDVAVTGGTRQTLNELCYLLANPGDVIWVEDPGYRGIREAARLAGLTVVPIPVDSEGLNLDWALTQAPPPQMIYVTPSHQYPLGMTMSWRRRRALLEYARQIPCWIIEDDYDSEYRYEGLPPTALAGMDPTGGVIYLGSWSKVLAPVLRLGYMVAPSTVIQRFREWRATWDHGLPGIDQRILTDFLEKGHFERHIRHTRAVYGARREAFYEAVTRYWGEALRLGRPVGGLSTVGYLPAGADDRRIAAQLAAHQIQAPPLSRYFDREASQSGLILGYAAYSPEQIFQAVRQVAPFWPEWLSG